jgi:hypothetical protein
MKKVVFALLLLVLSIAVSQVILADDESAEKNQDKNKEKPKDREFCCRFDAEADPEVITLKECRKRAKEYAKLTGEHGFTTTILPDEDCDKLCCRLTGFGQRGVAFEIVTRSTCRRDGIFAQEIECKDVCCELMESKFETRGGFCLDYGGAVTQLPCDSQRIQDVCCLVDDGLGNPFNPVTLSLKACIEGTGIIADPSLCNN